jgi:hypothetical protein
MCYTESFLKSWIWSPWLLEELETGSWMCFKRYVDGKRDCQLMLLCFILYLIDYTCKLLNVICIISFVFLFWCKIFRNLCCVLICSTEFRRWKVHLNWVFQYGNVAYLPHARTVEPQKQPFLSNTHTNNGTTGLSNPLLGNGLVNTLPHRRNDVTLQQYLAVMWLVFCVVSATQQ